MKNEYIAKRKAVRKFDNTPLSAELLAEIKDKIKSVKPLFSNIDYSVELVEDKNPPNQNARYYLYFNSRERMVPTRTLDLSVNS